MSNYSKTTDFEAKDSLPTGDSGKIIRGAEFETEFDAISTAIATKADTAGPTFTGTLTFETISDGTIGVTAFVDEDDMSSDSATLVPTQQSVKAYVDSQVTAQDLDFQADSGGALSIDLDSETLTFTGGTGIDTSGSGNAVTFAIDSTVATLTGTQTLTNKTLTSPDVNTPDIDGGTIDGTVIGGTTPAAVSATTVSATGNITVGGTVDGRDVATDGTKLDGIESGATADQTAAEIRTLVESATDSNVFTDADHTKLDGIEANATADQTDAEIRAAVEAATDSNVFTDADHSKLDGIEAGADVTDTANVTAAGALMDSEVTNLDQVKAFDSADYATAAQGSTADSALQNVVEDTTPQLGGDLASNGNDILFADNDKVIFGAGSDLQIYHDGAVSRISSSGTPLRITNGVDAIQLRASTLQLQDNSGYDYITTADNGNGGTVRLFYNASEVLETTSTGIDVTGGIAATDDSTFTAASGNIYVTASTPTGAARSGFRVDETANNGFEMAHDNADNAFFISRRSGSSTVVDALKIDRSTGDFSLFEDTGTTAKLFWDASAERLGIGETSPISALHVNAGATNTVSTFESTNSTVVLPLIDSVGSTQIRSIDGAFAIRTGGDAGASTGTTEQLRIDTSGNVGIGTTSPTEQLDVQLNAIVNESGAGDKGLFVGPSGFAGSFVYKSSGDAEIAPRSGKSLLFAASTGGTERMRIDSSGNVGINQSNPTRKLHVTSAGSGVVATFGDSLANNTIEVTRTTTNASYIGLSATSAVGTIIAGPTFTFSTCNSGGGSVTERMRIDSSGNLLVSGTSSSIDAGSISLEAQGRIRAGRDGGAVMQLNRTTSDGDVAVFYKDSVSFGSISSHTGGFLKIDTAGDSSGLLFGTSAIYPIKNDVIDDAAVDLGDGSNRFKDLYLSGVSRSQSTVLEDIIAKDTNGLNLQTSNGQKRVILDNSGNLLVGKSSSSTSGAGTVIEDASIGHARINLTSENTAATVVSFYYDNGTTATQVGTIVTSTTATTYNTSSDQRLKDNIVDAPSASDDIDAIQVRSFDWKADGSHQKYGMVAQELQSVAPEAVTGDADSDDMMGVDYSKLVPMLVKEIQSLRARVAQLEGAN